MQHPSLRLTYAVAYLVMILAAFSGCTTPQALRRNTIQQADTVADIHEQQVLDNLAKFIYDPFAIPSFAYATSGISEVTDRGSGVFGLNWNGTAFTGAELGGDGFRNIRDSWSTVAVTDPRKLELMRCAYQRTIATCGLGPGESLTCPDCRKRFNKFYTGREFQSQTKPDGTRCFDCDGHHIANLVSGPTDDPRICGLCDCNPLGSENTVNIPGTESVPPGTTSESDERYRHYCKTVASPGNGIANSECLYSSCWFCYGTDKKCVPDDCGYVGHYCGIYVWVPPGPSRDTLARLTLAILDYAVNEDRELPTKEVTAYLLEDGTLTTEAKAKVVVKATIRADEPSLAVIRPDVISIKEATKLRSFDDIEAEQLEAQRERILRLPPVQPRPQRPSPTPGSMLLPLEQQLDRVN